MDSNPKRRRQRESRVADGARRGDMSTSNLHVSAFEALADPDTIVARLPATRAAMETVLTARREICDALVGRDRRLVVVAGPCSIHDVDAAVEYARRLAGLRRKVIGTLIVVMRVYFEKPRTTIGWKGLINDPHLDGTHDINTGLALARKVLLEINELGLPCATEFLDPIVPQYTSDLVSWAAVGARTTESQTHREMASGLSMPVGFKNATDGQLDTAINALVSTRTPQAFLGIDPGGRTAIVRTTGNPDVHIVLRGGGGRSNYSAADIACACVALGAGKNARLILVDCSHDNSGKDYRKQPQVFRDVLRQYTTGQMAILGMMLESNLEAGGQEFGGDLVGGKSITDECIGWATTEQLLLEADKALRA